jgi:integrase
VYTVNINLKVVLYKSKKYQDGSHPIMIQYTIDRKRVKRQVDKCMEDEWDFKACRIKNKVEDSAKRNNIIAKELSKAEKDLYDIRSGEKGIDKIFSSDKVVTLSDCFNAEIIRTEREFKPVAYDNVLAIMRHGYKYDVNINSIDDRWINGFISALTDIGNGPSTIKQKVKIIRGIIARYSKNGISQDVKDIVVKAPKGLKQKLTREEFARLVEVELEPGSNKEASRDIFVLQVYLRGVRVGDLLQAYSGDFRDGRFRYQDDKTGKSHDVKLIAPAQAIVDKYAGKHERLFPFFKWKPDVKLSRFANDKARLKHKETCTALINYQLKLIAIMADITKPLSSHIARHTYARMAIDKINNPMITMELLGHSDLKVHQGYLNDIRKNDELDAANDDIFG